MLSSNDIFAPCWDREQIVSARAETATADFCGTAEEVREHLLSNKGTLFEVVVWQDWGPEDDQWESVGLPAVRC